MSAREPAVTVLTSVYNGEAYLAEALDSLLGQSFPDWECLIIDDGSTDGTGEIARRFAAADSRFRVHVQENQGTPRALNAGLEQARGRYVAILDADDAAFPERLERQAAHLRANPDVALVGGYVMMISGSGREFGLAEYPLEDAEIRAQLEEQNAFVHSAVMYRRELALDAGGYRPVVRLAEDLDLWLQLAERGRLANLAEPVTRYRVHATQVSITRLEEQVLAVQASLASARERRAGRPDPLDSVQSIDRSLMDELGVSDAEITRMTALTGAWWGRVLERAGDHGGARRAWAQAREVARGPGGGRELEAELLRERARVASGRGRRGAAALLRVRAQVLSRAGARR
ncbi:MAG TPA: glycosyltransferase [Thermoleophilaceae bacterium]|nr:glycosyltransferase [Thermoleophilaceae bacterium]